MTTHLHLAPVDGCTACLIDAATPTRCLCSHSKSQHRRGEGQCWSPVCGCSAMRPKETNQ